MIWKNERIVAVMRRGFSLGWFGESVILPKADSSVNVREIARAAVQTTVRVYAPTTLRMEYARLERLFELRSITSAW